MFMCRVIALNVYVRFIVCCYHSCYFSVRARTRPRAAASARYRVRGCARAIAFFACIASLLGERERPGSSIIAYHII